MVSGEAIFAAIAVFISATTLLVMIGEKLFGGGNALANKFHALETKTTADIAAISLKLTERVDQYEDNYAVGADAIKASIHALQIGVLEFRAKMAEEYIPKGGLDDIKADMRRGFEAVDRRMGELQDLVLWVRGDLPPPPQRQHTQGK